MYVDNDVDVDDVDDDEEGAAAYFFGSETAMAIPTVNYKSVEDKPLAWDSPGLLIFRFIAPDRDWNDRSELILIAKAFGN